MVLAVNGLKTYFYMGRGQTIRAVNGVSFTLSKGQWLALVGESGCGKSVTALSIMRLIPNPPGRIVSGNVIFNGKDLLQLSDKEIDRIRGNRIAMIFQEPMTSLNPVLTIERQLTEPLEIHRQLDHSAAVTEALRLLSLVGIPEPEKRIKHYPHQFSGGMQQRIMIAMALACNPEVLIADEPTTSVDVTVQAQLLELINELRVRFGTAVLLITHNLGVVARYAEYVMVMYAGRIVESAPARVLYSAPRHPYTAGLLAAVPRLDTRRRRGAPIPGLPPDLGRLEPNMCAFSPRCKFAMGECRKQTPPLEPIGPEHYVRCFRSHETDDLLRMTDEGS